MAPYKILKQGYMMKEPPVSKRGLRKKLHRYWFVLVEDPQQVALVYFKSEDSYIARQRNEGFIRVDNSVSINVISEHLGSKNAFVIRSVRTDYTLVPESRYDLHEWLFTLHNAIEAFKKKQKKSEERRRMPQRVRSNTVDSLQLPTSPPSHAGTSRVQSLTPTRRAPPAPPTAAAASRASSSPRRKPVRPAPVAPGARKRSQTQPTLSPTFLTSQEGVGHAATVLYSPPPAYSDASSGTPQDMGGVLDSLGSGVHPIMDLDIHTEQDEFEQGLNYHHGNEGGARRSLRAQSASDSLLLMHQNSASLPDLMNCENDELSMANGGVVTVGATSDARNGGSHLQRSASGASQTRHTRHLSLIGHEDLHAKHPPRDHRKKRTSRRNGSVKLRSRSPPNMPPPPPPTMLEDEDTMATNGQTLSGGELHRYVNETDVGLQLALPPPGKNKNSVNGELPSGTSSSSVGFSEVMNTISNIDHELDDITITPAQPSVPAPQRSAGESESAAQGAVGGEVKEDFNEEEWLCDVPDETAPISPNRPAPEGGPQSDSETEPIPKKPTNQVTSSQQGAQDSFVSAEQLVGGGFIPVAAVEITSDPGSANSKSGKGKHRVMFKEEVEDIPNYEPRVDREEQEEIPSSVAALKKKLFGAQEQGVTKYKKEGVMSPKHTHPSNVSFESGYTFRKESSPFYRENSPNVNNNNGLDVEQATPTSLPADQNAGVVEPKGARAAASAVDSSLPNRHSNGVAEEGLYDPPWETSAVSKFKVIGRIRAGSAGSDGKPTGKERTPPPVSPKTKKQQGNLQFGEVSMTEVPTPGSTELRNVHSLERSKHKKERKERQKQLQKTQKPQEEKKQQSQQERSPPVHSYSLDRPGHKESSLSSRGTGPGLPPHDRSFERGTSSPSMFATPSSSFGGVSNEDDSLLASITDTLQKQSKYGSDALLSPPTSRMSGGISEQQKAKKAPNTVRMSSRGELEKIRAAHRREPPPPPAGSVSSPVTPPTHSSPPRGTTPTHSSPQRIGNGEVPSYSRVSPPSAVPVTRTSPHPQAYVAPVSSSRKTPANQKGASPTTNSIHQNRVSPSHAVSVGSPKRITPLHSSQIIPSPSHHQQASSKRRMFSGRPRMAASLDELQTDPSTQVTYDASSKSHIFRSLV